MQIPQLIIAFARLRAAEAARFAVQTTLSEWMLLSESTPAHLEPLEQEVAALKRLAQIQAAMDVGRLNLPLPGVEVELYTSMYTRQFLAVVRHEWLAYLHAEGMPLLSVAARERAGDLAFALGQTLVLVARGA